MNRIEAIKILEKMLEARDVKFNESDKEVIKVAIQDMKAAQNKTDRRARWKENFDNMTEEDWRESTEASIDAWKRN